MKRIFAPVLTALIMACTSSNSTSFQSVSAEEFEAFISDTTVQRLDVRTPEEHAEGHIEGSLNIDVKNESFENDANAQLDKSRPVAIYCRSGRRSKQAADILVKNRFEVVELSTGFNGWTTYKQQ